MRYHIVCVYSEVGISHVRASSSVEFACYSDVVASILLCYHLLNVICNVEDDGSAQDGIS